MNGFNLSITFFLLSFNLYAQGITSQPEEKQDDFVAEENIPEQNIPEQNIPEQNIPEQNIIVDTDKFMNNQKLDSLINKLVPETEAQSGFWKIPISGLTATVVTDEKANRMRIMVPIIQSSGISDLTLFRMMQANFDSALDARYAIANDILWSTFIHPLSTLQDEEFISGLAQTITAAINYGGNYSSGGALFKGGDSQSIIENELLEDLLRRGKGSI